MQEKGVEYTNFATNSPPSPTNTPHPPLSTHSVEQVVILGGVCVAVQDEVGKKPCGEGVRRGHEVREEERGALRPVRQRTGMVKLSRTNLSPPRAHVGSSVSGGSSQSDSSSAAYETQL